MQCYAKASILTSAQGEGMHSRCLELGVESTDQGSAQLLAGSGSFSFSLFLGAKCLRSGRMGSVPPFPFLRTVPALVRDCEVPLVRTAWLLGGPLAPGAAASESCLTPCWSHPACSCMWAHPCPSEVWAVMGSEELSSNSNSCSHAQHSYWARRCSGNVVTLFPMLMKLSTAWSLPTRPGHRTLRGIFTPLIVFLGITYCFLASPD